MNDFLGWRSSDNDKNSYVEAIRSILSSDSEFNNFRQHVKSGYRTILEHLSYDEGLKYFKHIREFENGQEMLLDAVTSDEVGNPVKFNYDGILLNPTTLRYISTALDIEKKFGNLDGVNYVEIGGGYGGQAKILTRMFNLKSVKLFDIPQALELQKRYLSMFGVSCETLTIDKEFVIEENSFVVSNYAWCELDENFRSIYAEKVIRKCSKAFLTTYDVDVHREFSSFDNVKIETDHFNTCNIVSINENKN